MVLALIYFTPLCFQNPQLNSHIGGFGQSLVIFFIET